MSYCKRQASHSFREKKGDREPLDYMSDLSDAFLWFADGMWFWGELPCLKILHQVVVVGTLAIKVWFIQTAIVCKQRGNFFLVCVKICLHLKLADFSFLFFFRTQVAVMWKKNFHSDHSPTSMLRPVLFFSPKVSYLWAHSFDFTL